MWLLKQGGAPRDVVIEKWRADDVNTPQRIRCPHCEWQPDASSRWVCWSGTGPEPPFTGCGTSWQTFSTGGKCPGCAHQWQWTSCLRCGEWSLHEDWYEDGSED